ncbi:J domain-containing protein [Psidium guajava]|nr:J domain-containing protein [Psidium guajava]
MLRPQRSAARVGCTGTSRDASSASTRRSSVAPVSGLGLTNWPPLRCETEIDRLGEGGRSRAKQMEGEGCVREVEVDVCRGGGSVEEGVVRRRWRRGCEGAGRGDGEGRRCVEVAGGVEAAEHRPSRPREVLLEVDATFLLQ